MIAAETLRALSIETLRRKRDESWRMAECARQDGDKNGKAKHMAELRQYADEIHKRRQGEA